MRLSRCCVVTADPRRIGAVKQVEIPPGSTSLAAIRSIGIRWLGIVQRIPTSPKGFGLRTQIVNGELRG